jgi:hypothetical protein
MALNPDLKAKLDTATEHYEALIASERDRATYLLASMIQRNRLLNWKSGARIISWLGQAAESKPS